MCEKAEEIQKEWIPAIGDYIDPDGIVSIITSVYQSDEGYCSIGTNNVNTYGQMHPKSMFFWLPRQDQLQEMVADELVGLQTVCAVIYDFAISAGETSGITIDGTMEQLWLSFIMHEKYQKQWNSEKEEWTG